MSAQPQASREHGNAYNIFVLVLTMIRWRSWPLQILPLDAATLDLLRVYDNAICVIFLGDFLYNLTGSRPKRTYFIYQRGWLDLLGSLPTLGVFQLTALFRLARLSRLARIGRLMSGQNRAALIRDVVDNRGSYATFITLLSAGFVLISAASSSCRSRAGPRTRTSRTAATPLVGPRDHTTVGYGDRFPVTTIGRTTAVLVMLAGVGIIGALASILASLLVPDAEPPADEAAASGPDVATEPRVAARRDRRTARRSPPGRRAAPASGGGVRTSSQSVIPSRLEAPRIGAASAGEAVARSTSRGAVTRWRSPFQTIAASPAARTLRTQLVSARTGPGGRTRSGSAARRWASGSPSRSGARGARSGRRAGGGDGPRPDGRAPSSRWRRAARAKGWMGAEGWRRAAACPEHATRSRRTAIPEARPRMTGIRQSDVRRARSGTPTRPPRPGQGHRACGRCSRHAAQPC